MENNYNPYNPYTRKAPAKFLALAQSFRPTLPKGASIDQCFDAIAEDNGIEFELENSGDSVFARIYKDDARVADAAWPKAEMYDEKEMDWKWDLLLPEVVKICEREKAIRKVRRNKKTGEVIISKKEQKRLATPTFTPEQKEELRKCRQSLKNRLKTGRDQEGIQRLQARIEELEAIGLENTRRGMR